MSESVEESVSSDNIQSPSGSAPKLQLTLEDFDLLYKLGDGSYSTVVAATLKKNEKVYALKIMDKSFLLRNQMVEYVRQERFVLDRLRHPGIVQLHFTFQDSKQLFMGLELCPNGELFDQIQQEGKLSLDAARFYIAEVVDILQYLRQNNIVHRDIKPENLLLTESGHLKLIDFGSMKDLAQKSSELPTVSEVSTVPLARSKRRASSFVGTPDYISPEVLSNQAVSFATDLWSLGCLIYQMFVGKPPFKSTSDYYTFKRIVDLDFEYPDDVPPDAKDLCEKLLLLRPEKRLGSEDLEDLKKHPFFEGVKWKDLFQQEAPKYFPPKVPDIDDVGHDWELTSLMSALPIQYVYDENGNDQPRTL
eukprot:TRINITY_DN6934_c1_g1_i1.p1 TRINITY_DN6934_c1_g1~~TRINITY_DN6934_c1_g1_i1.p1  ORF type:complete len:371 (-),score=61.53 TRINITY_DN6934_c1_g1_i1:158-1243(-)